MHHIFMNIERFLLTASFFLTLQNPMDDQSALDLLSGDFSTTPKPPASLAVSTTKLEPPVLDSEPLKVAEK